MGRSQLAYRKYRGRGGAADATSRGGRKSGRGGHGGDAGTAATASDAATAAGTDTSSAPRLYFSDSDDDQTSENLEQLLHEALGAQGHAVTRSGARDVRVSWTCRPQAAR